MKKLICTTALSLVAGLALADTLTTVDGRKLEGKVRDGGTEWVLEGKYGSTRIDKSRVVKVEYGKTDLELYAEKAAALKDDDKDGHWTLALWCKEQGLEHEYKAEAAKVVDLDPEHEAARLALGHLKVDGKWLTVAEQHEANGEVFRDGKWMDERDAEKKDQEKRARELLQAAATKEDMKAQAAIDELLALRPDALIAPCKRALNNSSKEMRKAAWLGLGVVFDSTRKKWGILGQEEVQRRFDLLGDLSQLAIRESDPDLRKIAVEATRKFGDHYAEMWYQKRVVEEMGDAKGHAASVLGEMNNPASTGYLVAAFYTVYIEVRATNAQSVQDITDSFVDFIADPERRVITQPLRIETPKLAIQRVKATGAVPEGMHEVSEIAAALKKITGEDHGEDFEAWNDWYQKDGKKWVRQQVKEKQEKSEEK